MSPFGQTVLLDAHQHGPIVRQHGHTYLDHGALQAFVAHVVRSTRHQRRDVAFDYWAAVPTGTSQVHLMRGPDTLQAGRVEDVPDLVLTRRRVHWRHGGGNPHREDPAPVECLAQRSVIDPEIPTQGMDAQTVRGRDKRKSMLDLVEQRQHRTGITRIARGHPGGKNKAGRGLGEYARFPPKLGRAITLAFENRRNAGVIRIDDLAVRPPFTVGQTLRLFDDLSMGIARSLQVTQQALALGLMEGRGVLQECCRLLGPGLQGTTEVQQVPFGLSYERDEDFPLAPALATKASHDLVQGLAQRTSLGAQCGRGARGSLRDPFNELESFF